MRVMDKIQKQLIFFYHIDYPNKKIPFFKGFFGYRTFIRI